MKTTILNLFPAPAGMNRWRRYLMRPRTPVPRARGDEPPGWLCRASAHILFPAPAGMNRAALKDTEVLKTVPRARGDEPLADPLRYTFEGCSPRPRG